VADQDRLILAGRTGYRTTLARPLVTGRYLERPAA
jgi:hypothetical protein